MRTLIVVAVVALGGCHSDPWIPANVVHPGAHSSGSVLAFDAGTTHLASGGKDGTVSLWRLPDGERQSQWRAHPRSVAGVGFVGSELVTAGYEGTLAIWSDDTVLIARHALRAPAEAIAVAGKRVAVGHEDGAMTLWEVDNGFESSGVWEFDAGPVLSVASHEGEGYTAAGTADGRVFVVQSNGEVMELESAPGAVWALEFAPSGNRLTGAGWFDIYHWDLASAKIAVVDTPHYGLIKAIAYREDGRTLASISRQTDSQVYFLDAQTGEQMTRFQAHELCGSDVSVSPNGRFLASTSDDASVRIWDLDRPLPLQSGVRGI